MFTKRDLQELMETVSQSPIQNFKYSDGTTKIVIKKDAPSSASKKSRNTLLTNEALPASQEAGSLESAAMAETPQEASKPDLLSITAPMVGTFYPSADMGGTPFVQVGDKVSTETIVCVLEAMKLFMEVKSRVSGEIVEIVAEEGRLVEYGQTLFVIKPV